MKTVAVFFGGKSNEHEISVITGMLAVGLLREIYRVLPVYLPRGGGMSLAQKARGVGDFRTEIAKKFPSVTFTDGGLAYANKPKKKIALDCALNCCHGGSGEDGTLSALLDWYRIPSASPQTPVSAVFMDKALSKIAAKGLDIPVLPSFVVREEERASALERIKAFGYPVVMKPCKLGSSIGVTVAHDEREYTLALDLAFRLDDGVLVERYLTDKRDLNCAACRVGGECVLSPIEEVFSAEPILTFGEKYENAARASRIPAEIPEEAEQDICGIMRSICENFCVQGVVRGDFLYADGKVYFNELNTVPGSLALYLFGESLSFSRGFLQELIDTAMSHRRAEKETVQTGILESAVFSGAKACKRR